MFRTSLFLLGCAVAGCSSAFAADQKEAAPAEVVVVEQVTADDVAALLKDDVAALLKQYLLVDVTGVETSMYETTPIVTFSVAGAPFLVALSCPSAKTCNKISAQVSFVGDYPLEYVNKVNLEIDLTIVRGEKNRFTAVDSFRLSGGVTRANIAFNLAVFVVSAYQAIDSLKSQIVAGAVGVDPAIREKQTLWQAMVVKPDLNEAVAMASRSRPRQ